MPPIEAHLRAMDALLLSNGWQPLPGEACSSARCYLRGSSAITLTFDRADRYTATGSVRVTGDGMPGPDDLLTGYRGPPAELVAVFTVEDHVGSIVVAETVGDEATQTSKIVPRPYRSPEEFCAALTTRTDEEVQRRLMERRRN